MNLKLKPWEEDLLLRTTEFVKQVAPHLPADKEADVIARIYSDMRRTLKLFEDKR